MRAIRARTRFQEERLLGPEDPEHVGLPDARLVRDCLDRRTVKSMMVW
jgi:hypothetical protein